MARFNSIRASFSSGEVSPKLEGRVDLQQFESSASKIQNFIVEKEGGLLRRPGTELHASSIGGTTLISWIRDEQEQEIYTIAVSYSSFRGFSNPLSEGRSRRYTSTGISGESMPVDTDEIQTAQSVDLLYTVHPNLEPQYLRPVPLDLIGVIGRTHDLRSFWIPPNRLSGGVVPLPENFPFVQNADTTTMVSSAATGTVTLTRSGGSFAFTAKHIGAIFRFAAGAARVTAFGTSASVTALVIEGSAPTVSTTDWAEQAWSDERGWPRSVTFHEGRLVFGGNKTYPDTIWASELGNFQIFGQKFSGGTYVFGTAASDAFDITLSSPRLNNINWLVSKGVLFSGTADGEYSISNFVNPLSGSVPSALRQTSFGSKYVQPVESGSVVVFVERAGRNLREFYFDNDQQSFVATNLSFTAEHLPKLNSKNPDDDAPARIKRLSIQRENIPVIWVIDDNGGLFAVTRDRESGVAAWHRHEFGGNLSGGPPEVLSIATIGANDGDHDETYFLVRRTIDSAPQDYHEVIGREYYYEDLVNSSADIRQKPVFLDSAKLVRLGSPGKVFTGFSHLRGELVDALVDGQFYKDLLVSAGGVITLPPSAPDSTEIIAGLRYESILQTQRIDAGGAIGTSQGSVKRIDRATFRFNRTISAEVGTSESDLDELIFRPPLLPMDEPIPFFTGDKRLELRGDYDRELRLVVKTNKPFPMNLLSIIYRGVSSDG